VRGEIVLIGDKPDRLTYADLLAVLQPYGIGAVEVGGYVELIPESDVRVRASTVANDNDTYPDAQFVTRVIPVKSVSAAMLIPVLRPLLPQSAHFTAVACSNAIVVVDTFANVKRVSQIIGMLDKGETIKAPTCGPDGLVTAGQASSSNAH
jgi:general secretion pathway protein D